VPPALGVATTVLPLAVAIRISRLGVAAVAIVAPPRIRPGRVVHVSARRRVPTVVAPSDEDGFPISSRRASASS
jgi:hypothetical protein